MNQRTQEAITTPGLSNEAGSVDAGHDVTVLNSLISTTFDSVEGYAAASNEEDTGTFGKIFSDRATERRQVVTLLQDEVRRLGSEPEDSGSMLGGMHRMFTQIKALATKRDETLIKDVEAGEDHIKAKYEEAMADTRLLPTTRTAISQAYDSVRAGHDQMSQLKHSLDNSRQVPGNPDGV